VDLKKTRRKTTFNQLNLVLDLRNCVSVPNAFLLGGKISKTKLNEKQLFRHTTWYGILHVGSEASLKKGENTVLAQRRHNSILITKRDRKEFLRFFHSSLSLSESFNEPAFDFPFA